MGIFGLNLTSTINQSIQKVTKRIEQEYDNTQSNKINNISAAITTVNITIGPGGVATCAGGLTMNSEAKATAKTLLAITQLDDVEFDNDLFAQLTSDIETEVEQANEGGLFGGIGDTNIASTITETLKASDSEIKQTIKSTLENSMNQNASATGELTFKILGKLDVGGECVWNANAISESIASVISDKVNKVLLDNNDISELNDTIKTKVAQKNLGIDPTMAMIIIFILFGLGGIGGLGGVASGGKGILIAGILLLLIGIGLGVLLFFINTDSCEDGEDPTNKKECLKEKDKEEGEEEIKCICKDSSEYESRPWSDWLWLTCFIGSISCGVFGLILLLVYGTKAKGSRQPVRMRRFAEPNIAPRLVPESAKP